MYFILVYVAKTSMLGQIILVKVVFKIVHVSETFFNSPLQSAVPENGLNMTGKTVKRTVHQPQKTAL